MKNLEKKLFEMKIPQIENDPFEEKLRNELIARYHSPEQHYRKKFRYAVTFAGILAFFLIISIIFPRITSSINQFAFQSQQKEEAIEKVDYNSDFYDISENFSKNFFYTSIHNPDIKKRIDPKKYKEEKAYLIRKYISPDSQAVMIISEFNRSNKIQKPREASF